MPTEGYEERSLGATNFPELGVIFKRKTDQVKYFISMASMNRLTKKQLEIFGTADWNGLGNMASIEVIRLFVKILEEEDPRWYSRAVNYISVPVIDVEMNHDPKADLSIKNEMSLPETKSIPTGNGNSVETHDKDIMVEGFGSVSVYDQWVAPNVSGTRPKPRYEHAAVVIDDKMYVFGGNHNGRYLNDLQTLNLRN
ncbi:acyl-CoA-binding domain-containing protein 6-like [Lactuca sativa]|nr:acyl-CoA-binding domain-containing protein 6-like [Lactuca sativa]